MADWAEATDNTAIQDVTARMKELIAMHNAQQDTLTDATERCVEVSTIRDEQRLSLKPKIRF